MNYSKKVEMKFGYFLSGVLMQLIKRIIYAVNSGNALWFLLVIIFSFVAVLLGIVFNRKNLPL